MQLFFNFNRSCFFVVYFGKIEILVVRETRIALEKGTAGKSCSSRPERIRQLCYGVVVAAPFGMSRTAVRS